MTAVNAFIFIQIKEWKSVAWFIQLSINYQEGAKSNLDSGGGPFLLYKFEILRWSSNHGGHSSGDVPWTWETLP